MKKRKRIIITAFVIGILFIALIGFFVFYYVNNSDRKAFEAKYGIDLPNNMKIEYKAEEMDFHGEGVKYIVFKLKSKASDEFRRCFMSSIFSSFTTEFESSVNTVLADFDLNIIPEKYLPDWEHDYFFIMSANGHAFLYIIYYPDSLRLIVCEKII